MLTETDIRNIIYSLRGRKSSLNGHVNTLSQQIKARVENPLISDTGCKALIDNYCEEISDITTAIYKLEKMQ